jgi:hypothetical protein
MSKTSKADGNGGRKHLAKRDRDRPNPQAPPARWYHGAVPIAACLLCCYPLGAILLWMSPKTGWITKILGTVFFGLLAFFVLVILRFPSLLRHESTTMSAAVAVPTASASAERDLPDSLVGSSASSFEGDRLVACMDIALVREPLEQMFAQMLALANAPDAGRKLRQLSGKVDGGMSVQGAVDDEVRVFLNGGDTLVGRLIDEAHGKGTAAALRPKGKPTPIGKPCRAQFSGRTILASCTFSAHVQLDAGPEWRMGAEIIYFDALGDDRAMRACLSAKGNWEELPKNSAEFMNEKHDQMFKRLLKDLPQPPTMATGDPSPGEVVR